MSSLQCDTAVVEEHPGRDAPDENPQTEGPSSPQFILILQDDPYTGELSVAGVQRPEKFDNRSPAHIVGRFLQANIEQVVEVARAEFLMSRRLGNNFGEERTTKLFVSGRDVITGEGGFPPAKN